MKWPIWIIVALAAAGCSKQKSAPEVYVPRPKGTLTFTNDPAAIMFTTRATCHRPGQAAHFSLLTYSEVQKRARNVAEVTSSRYMPPWMPAPGYVHFAGERRLSIDQIGVIQQWFTEGAPEGNA